MWRYLAMNLVKCGMGLVFPLALMAVAVTADDEKKKKEQATEVIINIKGPGAKGKYVKDGDNEQKDVTVTVGQKVTWKNEKGNAPHTATSKLKVDDKAVFDTEKLVGGDNKTIVFDEALYKKAGGKDGKEVELEYYCRIHGENNMKSKIILKPAAK
jgi:plastocyanin